MTDEFEGHDSGATAASDDTAAIALTVGGASREEADAYLMGRRIIIALLYVAGAMLTVVAAFAALSLNYSLGT